MTRALVICAGEATRWGDYTGRPKHLIEIGGERLLDRTTRLAREYGAREVLVVAKPGHPEYASPGAQLVEAHLDPSRYDADKFLSSRHLWSTRGRTVVLYGDCYFTDEAMDVILTPREDWTHYCRFTGSAVTGATSGECFAVGFWPQHHAEYEAALHRVALLRRRGVLSRCGGWETYRAMNGVQSHRLRAHRAYARHVVIDDLTEDFDKPADYDRHPLTMGA